jgi:hypothetical protein
VKTDGLLIMLDESLTMFETFPRVRAKARRFLEARKNRPGHDDHIECIKYSTKPRSALEALLKVNDETINRVDKFLAEEPILGKETNLASAFEKAAEEVVKFRNPTMIVILTDGKDKSIREILGDIVTWKSKFKDVKVRSMSTPSLPVSSARGPASTCLRKTTSKKFWQSLPVHSTGSSE